MEWAAELEVVWVGCLLMQAEELVGRVEGGWGELLAVSRKEAGRRMRVEMEAEGKWEAVMVCPQR